MLDDEKMDEEINLNSKLLDNVDLSHDHGLLIKEGGDLLDSSDMELLKNYVDTDNEEFIVYVAKRDFWYLNKYPFIFSILGTILLVIIAALILSGKIKLTLYTFSFFGAFPILMVYLLISYFT